MSRSKEMDLTTGNPFWSLLLFAIPVILGNLFQLFLYFGRFCNRWKNSWGPVTGCSRLHQHHHLFRFLFHQWLHRRLWHLPWTELRSQK